MQRMRIIDGDGHLFEDAEAIARHLPSIYHDGRSYANIFRIFPPLDHLHTHIGRLLPGAFNNGNPVGPKEWKEFLEEVGIEQTVLYPTAGLSYGKIVNRDWAIAVTRAYNDWLAETYLADSPVFKGMALLPIQEPEAAVEELRRAVTQLGMLGAMLPSTTFVGHIGQKQLWPIYAEANRLGCCLGVHGGCHEDFNLDDMNVYAPVHALGHPFGQMVSFAGVVFNGLLDKFPNVRWAFLEGGVAWLLVALERFDRSWETHVDYNPRGELIQLREGERVSDYVRRHIKEGRIFVGCEGEEPDLAHAIRSVGSEPFMFSSDYPHEVNAAMCKHELAELLENEEISEADKAAVLYRNAQRFYGL
jgi:predicted TIM-barrel fold metal-dependent hydrolase